MLLSHENIRRFIFMVRFVGVYGIYCPTVYVLVKIPVRPICICHDSQCLIILATPVIAEAYIPNVRLDADQPLCICCTVSLSNVQHMYTCAMHTCMYIRDQAACTCEHQGPNLPIDRCDMHVWARVREGTHNLQYLLRSVCTGAENVLSISVAHTKQIPVIK